MGRWCVVSVRRPARVVLASCGTFLYLSIFYLGQLRSAVRYDAGIYGLVDGAHELGRVHVAIGRRGLSYMRVEAEPAKSEHVVGPLGVGV